MIAFITGSGFYDFPGLGEDTVATRFGEVALLSGELDGHPVVVLPRHGKAHRDLPHQINHRANLVALKERGATAVVSCSVCGIVNPEWETGTPLIADDLWFPENRLGDGAACTIFDRPGEPGRGHLLASSFFEESLSRLVRGALETIAGPARTGCYAQASGPRFNSKAEIRGFRRAGADFLSQTCGAEAVLANECELPFALAGFGVDYANGVQDRATPVDQLNANLVRSRETFETLIRKLAAHRAELPFTNFVYRFE